MTTEDAILNNLDLMLQRIEESLDRLEGLKPAAAQRVPSQSQLSPQVSSSSSLSRVLSSGNLQVSDRYDMLQPKKKKLKQFVLLLEQFKK